MCQHKHSSRASLWGKKAYLDCLFTKNRPEVGLERAGGFIHHILWEYHWWVLLSDMGDNSNSLFVAVFVPIRPHFGEKHAPISFPLAPFLRCICLFAELRR